MVGILKEGLTKMIKKMHYKWNEHLVNDTNVRCAIVLYTNDEPTDLEKVFPNADYHINFTDTRHEWQAWNDFDVIMSEASKFQVFTSRHAFMLNHNIRPDIVWLFENDTYTRLPNSTTRELREAHNLQRMYIAGSFSDNMHKK